MRSCGQGKHRKTIKPKQRWRVNSVTIMLSGLCVCVRLRNLPDVLAIVIDPRAFELRPGCELRSFDSECWHASHCATEPLPRENFTFLFSLGWLRGARVWPGLWLWVVRKGRATSVFSAFLKGPSRPPPSNLPGMFCNPYEGPSVALYRACSFFFSSTGMGVFI